MTTERPTYATKIESGKIAIIHGTDCSSGYCREYGCDFPNCATFGGEEFNTEEEAKQAHSDFESVQHSELNRTYHYSVGHILN